MRPVVVYRERVFGRVTVDVDKLRVGRKVVPLEWLDPLWVRQIMANPMLRDGRVPRRRVTSLGTVWRLPSSQELVLRDRWGRSYRVAVRRRHEFLEALTRVLPPT